MTYSCPRCSSENVQKLSLVHGKGTAGISTTTFGVGVGGGRGGVAVATTDGKSQSLLAQRYAPPKRESAAGQVGCLTAIGLGLGFLAASLFNSEVAFWIVMALAVLLAIALVRQTHVHNRDQYPKQRALWESRYICLRCEHVFEQALVSRAPAPASRDDLPPVSSAYLVRLLSAGPNTISVLSAIRGATDLKLLDAKALATNAPSIVRSGLSREEAVALKSRLDDAGATTEILQDRVAVVSSVSDGRPEAVIGHGEYARHCLKCGKLLHRPDRSCADCEEKQSRKPSFAAFGVLVFLVLGAAIAYWISYSPGNGSDPAKFRTAAPIPPQVIAGRAAVPAGANAFSATVETQPLQSPSKEDAPSSNGAADATNDPIATVRRFYDALSSADGDAAASYVVSDKRHSGPLSGPELKARYSALQSPLKLADVWSGSNGLVYAHYSYTSADGLKCLASSAVKLVSENGDLYIGDVYVNEKCQ